MSARNKHWVLWILIVAMGFCVGACTTVSMRSEKSRLILSFYSIAGGPDYPSQQQVDEFFERYEKNHAVKLTKNIVYWGREGEFDYCLSLQELNRTDQKTFISDIRSLSNKLTHVDFYENEPCRNSRSK